MKNKITSSILLLIPLFVFGQAIDNFDALPDADYWGYEISENADSTLSFVNVSYITDPVTEGAGAMQLDYSAHNIEAWGGYAKIFHMLGGGDDEAGSPIEGTWKMAPEAGALMVGPAPNNGDWWSNSADDVVTRACYFDDEYVFSADGSFQNVLQDTSWIEGWQGGTDACGVTVYPHDGSNAATYAYDTGAGTVTLTGVGAYLGLPKVYNGGELSDPEIDNKDVSGFTFEGPEIDLIKKTVQHFVKGELDAYRSCFSDNATFIHNQWGWDNSQPIDELVKIHQAAKDQRKGDIEILNQLYEVVTVPNGSKFGHGWFEFSSENKTGEKFVNTVFVGWGFDGDKLAWEWAIYNTANSPEPYKK
ncbi:MAG: hypothetical protein QGF69_01265 [Candidatus Marinimicrobia bacterium]|nr:hypothetical protein [Candidatus Neomarinimicrobiota bacterium]